MTDAQVEAQKYLDIILSSEIRADLVSLFRKNPGIIDTPEGIARRMGYLPKVIQSDLDEITGLGVIGKKKLGNREIYFLNHDRDTEVQQTIGSFLQNLKPTP
jgi:hypothetical protein